MPSLEELHKKRIHAVRLHKEEIPIMTIVKETGLSYPAVKNAINLNNKGGEKALKPAERGKKLGEGRTFTKKQEDEIKTILLTRKPWQVGIKEYSYQALWNREIFKQMIQDFYGITLSSRNLGKYLYRWGYPPLPQNYQPIAKCTRGFRNEIKANKKLLDKYRSEDIFWISMRKIPNDENKRQFISAIDNHRKEHWMIIEGAFTAKKQIKFFGQLIKKSRRGKILIIRQSSHKFNSETVLRWLYRRSRNIKFFPMDQEAYESIVRKVEQEKLAQIKYIEEHRNDFYY